MNARKFSITGLLRITRVKNLVIIAITQYLTAIFLVGPSEDWKGFLMDFRLFLIVLSTSLISSAGYIINDYYDRKIDIINRPSRVIVGTDLKRRAVMFYHTLFNFIGVVLGILASPVIGIIHLTSSFLLWLHSNSLKRMPLIGNLLVGTLTGAAILLTGFYYKDLNSLIFAYALFGASTMVLRELIKDIEDMQGEKEHGVRSLPLVIGVRKTKQILFIIIGITAIFLLVFLIKVNNKMVIYYFISLVPFMCFFLYKLKKADTIKHFTSLKNYTNLIILTGIVSMILH